MKNIRQVKIFRRDLKRMKSRGKKLDKLAYIVDFLAKSEAIPPKHHPHKLSGNWHPKMECHIEPDWLLIYEEDDEVVTLYRTGSHSDLF